MKNIKPFEVEERIVETTTDQRIRWWVVRNGEREFSGGGERENAQWLCDALNELVMRRAMLRAMLNSLGKWLERWMRKLEE